MNGYKLVSLLIILGYVISLSLFAISSGPKASEEEQTMIVLEFYYVEGCTPCEATKPIIRDIEDDYANNPNVTVSWRSLEINKYLKVWRQYKFKGYPSVILRNNSMNESSIYYDQHKTILFDTDEYNDTERFDYPIYALTYENLKREIEFHLNLNDSVSNDTVQQSGNDGSNTKIPTVFGSIDYSDYSLPVITIILAAADSVNPCSFFILLFLLSILLHTRSRKRMLLVGGIFIFFSGFIYFLLMVLISEIEDALDSTLLAIFAGAIAIIFGTLNIKDFFFFKQGVSTSIPKEQKSKLYRQMRNIVKISSIPTLIGATIIFAISANTVELLCSIGLPLVYTGTILPLFSLSSFETYLYLIFYNVIYVIPLIIIVSIIVYTLGRWKLTEFQGQQLKLFSGFMILSLGLLLILRAGLLQNMFFTIGILLISLILTYILSLIWKAEQEYEAL